MIALWYCYDDALAAAAGIPGLGLIPIWVWVMRVGSKLAGGNAVRLYLDRWAAVLREEKARP